MDSPSSSPASPEQQRAAAGAHENAQLRHMLDQAQQQGAAQNAQMQQMAQQLQALMQQQAAAPRGPHMGKMDGTAKYSGGIGGLDAWLMKMRQLIEFNCVLEPQHVAYAAAHLDGPALGMWSALGQGERPGDWAALVALLARHYQPINAAELARGKLRSLKQGGRAIAVYVSEAQRLFIDVPNMHAHDRIFALIQGLDPRTRAHVEELAPTTLDATIERAVRFSSRASAAAGSARDHMDLSPMELAAIAAVNGDATPVDGDAAAARGKAPATHAELQQLFALLRSGTRPPAHDKRERGSGGQYQLPVLKHLNPTQVREYMEKGKCFQCGETGHASRWCPHKGKPKGTN